MKHEFNDNVDVVAKEVATKLRTIAVLEWLRYQDELLDRYILGKVKPLEIYNRFIDDTKNG
jgi:hypothetical protein